ncbi:hypothetical protein LWI29_016211 [Acer saccharum]|uniref:Uncharacterized protein n=1 Tax=Acer saccharum TaxID=4024 RepID=A0AA39VT65_ACESA|nr:hypothetical protein LWI29_016211 [Acer saccharum]
MGATSGSLSQLPTSPFHMWTPETSHPSYSKLQERRGVHQMQNEGSNGGHSCEQDLEKQGKSQEGLSVVGSGALALDRRLATQFLLSPEMSRWIQEFFFGCQNCLLMVAQLGKLINLQQLSLSSNRTCQAEKFYTID